MESNGLNRKNVININPLNLKKEGTMVQNGLVILTIFLKI